MGPLLEKSLFPVQPVGTAVKAALVAANIFFSLSFLGTKIIVPSPILSPGRSIGNNLFTKAGIRRLCRLVIWGL